MRRLPQAITSPRRWAENRRRERTARPKSAATKGGSPEKVLAANLFGFGKAGLGTRLLYDSAWNGSRAESVMTLRIAGMKAEGAPPGWASADAISALGDSWSSWY